MTQFSGYEAPNEASDNDKLDYIRFNIIGLIEGQCKPDYIVKTTFDYLQEQELIINQYSEMPSSDRIAGDSQSEPNDFPQEFVDGVLSDEVQWVRSFGRLHAIDLFKEHAATEVHQAKQMYESIKKDIENGNFSIHLSLNPLGSMAEVVELIDAIKQSAKALISEEFPDFIVVFRELPNFNGELPAELSLARNYKYNLAIDLIPKIEG